MARCLLQTPECQAADPATSLQLNYHVTFYGSDLPGNAGTMDADFSVVVLYADTPAQANTKIMAALNTLRTNLGIPALSSGESWRCALEKF